MSEHWRLALWGAVFVATGAIVVGAWIFMSYGLGFAGAFEYGAGIGLVSFASTALTVSLLMGSSEAGGMMIGGLSFMGRYGFVAAALGVPAYLELWPVLAMIGGFAGVYLAENILLLPMAARVMRRYAENKDERRAEV